MPWLRNLVGPWGAPGDAVAWSALLLGFALLVLAIAKRERALFLLGVRESAWVRACALAAAFASLGYVAFYLRGGPRIIDATAYFHEARAIAAGHFGTRVPFPGESFRGRFLLYDAHASTVTGLFPPGYPLWLSLGVRLGAPLAMGPITAALLIFATAWLAREMCARTTLAPETRALVLRVATLAQMLSATMRYHTADTMSHGLSALLVTTALAAALHASHARPEGDQGGAPWRTGAALCAGLCVGALAATRLASAPPLAILVVAVVVAKSERRALLLPLAVGVIPGALLLLASQRAATGSAVHSAQQLYYARSDGPAGCFRYGFGDDVGCVFEHGDFVRARLSSGYGLVSVLGVTLRRLRAHLTDVQNLEPLALVPLVMTARTRRAALLGLSLFAMFVLAYAPFYFDGNYPGGGARFYADVLPVEHVLFALGAAALQERVATHASYTRIAASLLGLGLVGFAVHASFDHRALRAREGGHPMFEREVLAAAGVTRGLVLVDTDHGFFLGHDPAAHGDASHGVVVARLRGDASDRVLYESLGAPPTYRYERAIDDAPARVSPFNVPPARVSGLLGYRFEAENEWPALTEERDPDTDGYAIPAWASGGCASAGRVLRITTGNRADAHVEIMLPFPEDRRYWLSLRVRGTGSGATMRVRVLGADFLIADPGDGNCVDTKPLEVALTKELVANGAHEAHVDIVVHGKASRADANGANGANGASMPASMDLDALTLRP